MPSGPAASQPGSGAVPSAGWLTTDTVGCPAEHQSPDAHPGEGDMRRLTGWVLDHRRLVLLAWLVLAVAGGALAPTTIDRLGFDFSTPGQPGYETNADIGERFGTGGDVDPLLVTVTVPEGATISGAGGELAELYGRLAQPGWRVATPLDGTPGAEALVSDDDRTAVALVWPQPIDGQ